MTSPVRRGPRVRVRVPATAANLGPGYDCFGLALERTDEVEAELDPTAITVRVTGIGAGEVPTDATHLVVRAAVRAWAAAGERLPGLRLSCRNAIPHGGGLGSSAAAIVAGLLVGRALLPEPAVLSEDRILELATELEGHPDNVAPAVLGGFTLAWTGADGRPRAVRRAVHPDIRAVVFAASGTSSTHHTRTLLPQQIPHRDAVTNVAAAALLVHAMSTDPALLFEATVDRLHQPYRAGSMPVTAALVADLRAAGIAAVVSGAGPSVLALTSAPFDPEPFRRNGFQATEVGISAAGAELTLVP